MSNEDIRAIVEAQKAAKHKREVERMAAASPAIRRARNDERLLDAIFGAKR